MNEYSKEVGYFLDLRKAIDGVKAPETGGDNAIKDTRLVLLMALENQFDHWLAAQVPFKKAGITPGTSYRVGAQAEDGKFMAACPVGAIVRVKAVTSHASLWQMYRAEGGEIIVNAQEFSPEAVFKVHVLVVTESDGPLHTYEAAYSLGAFLQEKQDAHWEMLLDGVK